MEEAWERVVRRVALRSAEVARAARVVFLGGARARSSRVRREGSRESGTKFGSRERGVGRGVGESVKVEGTVACEDERGRGEEEKEGAEDEREERG